MYCSASNAQSFDWQTRGGAENDVIVQKHEKKIPAYNISDLYKMHIFKCYPFIITNVLINKFILITYCFRSHWNRSQLHLFWNLTTCSESHLTPLITP